MIFLLLPFVQVFDAHSLWHATALLTALFWHHFILWDLRPMPTEGADSVTLLIVLLGIVAYLQVVAFVVTKLK